MLIFVLLPFFRLFRNGHQFLYLDTERALIHLSQVSLTANTASGHTHRTKERDTDRQTHRKRDSFRVGG
jgi:hypothetical protein